MIDKIEQYTRNDYAGSWQNVVCALGDDGNENQHMKDAHAIASLIEQLQPAMQVKGSCGMPTPGQRQPLVIAIRM